MIRLLACAALAFVLLVAGCARPEPAPFTSPFSGRAEFSGNWTFRHAALLALPARDLSFSFTGLMRLDGDAGTAHVVGLGGMGLTFFDLAVTRDALAVRFLHPSVARVPRAAEYIAGVVRSVWLGGGGGPVRDLAYAGSGVSGSGPWPERMDISGEGFTLHVRLLEASRK